MNFIVHFPSLIKYYHIMFIIGTLTEAATEENEIEKTITASVCCKAGVRKESIANGKYVFLAFMDLEMAIDWHDMWQRLIVIEFDKNY